MIRISVADSIPANIGVVRADGVDTERYPDAFASTLERVLKSRAHGLDDEAEAVRAAARDMLRHGVYKPTGRGKPASEYLLRAAARGEFPRINSLVDLCNLVSLQSVCPISTWDRDRAGAETWRIRHGVPGEAYVFNPTGQAIDLVDLLVACRVTDAADPAGEPVLNPVKDSMVAKTHDRTTRVGALVYLPPVIGVDRARALLAEYAAWLADAGASETAYGLVEPGNENEI